MREGIPLTTVARTLLDLSEVVGPRKLRRAFEEADRLRLLDLAAVERLRERSAGRHGLKPIAALMGEYCDTPFPQTRSELERAFVDLCREAGLPVPVLNASVAGFEVDALWPDRRLVVELDGFTFHHTRAAFERDRAKDAELQLAGYRVLRVTSRRLIREPATVIRTVREMLAAGLDDNHRRPEELAYEPVGGPPRGP